MRLGDKIRYLREMEGALRGLGRAMTQLEVVQAVRKEMHQSISQSYLSQIENGSRQHLTSTTRQLLASFFKVHPGYLVSDPEGFHTELLSNVRTAEETLDSSLINAAESFRNDPELQGALLKVARHDDTRKCFILLAAILDTPGLADRLLHVLRGQTT
jgi:transcriptional regulator with XRE-family HTH domain